ncbi:MAG: chemotaxis protein CheW [Burkholderiales bacterium]
MSARITLREFQQDLSHRLATAAASQGENTSVLAVQSGGKTWFMALAEAGEVLPVPKLTVAPLIKLWYAGLANVRGNLYSVVDFGAFHGAPPMHIGPASRLLLCGRHHGLNAGLLVDRVLGLRDSRELTPIEHDVPAWPWQKSVKQDAEGQCYWELDTVALMKSAEFMNIGI